MSTTPHDALFKHTFSQPENAAGELRSVLPAGVVERIDFASLKHEPTTFVDDDLRDRHADLLFSARVAGRPALLYLLLEHQSEVEPLMPVRVVRYMTRIWDWWLANHKGARHLPLIIPVVVHHSDTGWKAAVALEELFDVPPELAIELGDYLPRFRFVLDDLSKESDAALKARAMTTVGKLALWALRDGRRPRRLGRSLAAFRDLILEVNRSSGVGALAAILRYFLLVSGLQQERLAELVRVRVGEEVMGAMKTAGEMLVEKGRIEGRSEGRSEGRLEGRREALLQGLQVRFGSVPHDIVVRIEQAGLDELTTWNERLFTAKTLANVFGDA